MVYPYGSQSDEMPYCLRPHGYVSIDAFRGFVMLMLVSGGFGIAGTHVEWEGASFWDLIQPAFMFIVGVAMAFAFSQRKEVHQPRRQIFMRVITRCLKLILLSQILIIIADGRVYFQLIDVLSQIAFTYFITFLIIQLKFRWQVVSAALILIFHSGLFMMFPGPNGAFSQTENIGLVIDKALLGYNYPGSYVTINFISSTATTLFGAWAGRLLESQRPNPRTFKILGVAAVTALASGLLLSPVIPIIKRLWTASFTLYSTGWVLIMMIIFIFLIEKLRFGTITTPLIVVGMNSIFIYSISHMLEGTFNNWVGVFSGGFEFMGPIAPAVQSFIVVFIMWYLCYWLYQRRIFILV